MIQELGEDSAAVIDGVRPATPPERAAALLSYLHLEPQIYVLPRPGQDQDADVEVLHAEDRADHLALELVAPETPIRAIVDELSARQALTSEAMCTALATYFGLPAYAFDDAIRSMFRRRPPSWVADIAAGLRPRR